MKYFQENTIKYYPTSRSSFYLLNEERKRETVQKLCKILIAPACAVVASETNFFPNVFAFKIMFRHTFRHFAFQRIGCICATNPVKIINFPSHYPEFCITAVQEKYTVYAESSFPLSLLKRLKGGSIRRVIIVKDIM